MNHIRSNFLLLLFAFSAFFVFLYYFFNIISICIIIHQSGKNDEIRNIEMMEKTIVEITSLEDNICLFTIECSEIRLAKLNVID